MNTCPRYVLMLTNLSFFFLLITATNAQDKHQPDDLITKPLLITINPAGLVPQLNSTSSPHPKPAPNPTSSNPKPEGPESNSTSPSHLKPAPKSNSAPSPSPIPAPKPDPTLPHSKPEIKPEPTSPHLKPAPTPKPAPKPDTTSPNPKPAPKPDTTSPNPKPAPKPDPTSQHSKPEIKPEPTSPHPKPAPNPKPEPKPDPTSQNPKPAPKPDPTSQNPKPETKPDPTSAHPKPAPKPDPTSPHPKPAPKPDPKKTVPPKPDTTTKSTASSSPYHFANHFCLSRRLDVKSTFCLQVLRSSPASTKANDNQALLNIAAEMSIKYGEKTLAFLKKMSADKTTKPDLKPAIEDCVSAYEGYLTQYKMLMEEVGSDGQVASYDSELAKIEINSCVRALSKNKNADIVARNKVALDYARLTQNIADSLE